MRRNKFRNGLILLCVIVFGPAGGFVVWANSTPEPMPEALAALASDNAVAVTIDPWLIFEPAASSVETVLIIYPGGRVDPRAYAPGAYAISRAGYRVIILPMPLNLAVFAPDRAREVINAYPDVKAWVLGGHSLGGAMAASFASESPESLAGLALWAAYPAEADNLSGLDMPVLSIFGTRDGLASLAEVEASRALLPPDTIWLPIEGGNHAQFGWYGSQSGDNEAIISRQEQQDQIVAGMVNF